MARHKSRLDAPRVTTQHAIGYADDVIAGRIEACRYTILACERFKRDLVAAESGGSPWEFRADLADRAMLFAGCLPNIKGPEAGEPLRLMGWQAFIFANVFGFVARGTTTRRFRQGIIFCPRGNGKTSLAAPIALYLTFLEGEGGAEGYAAAVTREQARILFDTAQHMVRRTPELTDEWGVGVFAHSIFQARTASKFIAISSDAKALDGLNVQVAVCDEIGSHKSSHVYDVLLTAMGKRKHPFLLSISTATGNNTGIGKTLWDYGVKVLEGAVDDEAVFALLYTIDDGDDPWDESVWIKANPSWGQAVQPDAIRAIMRQARNNPAQEAAAKTRHLNVWVGADDALFSTRSWRLGARPELDLADFEGRDCHLGLDLASKTDLAALAIVFPEAQPGATQLRYSIFARCYINEAAVQEARNASYPGWAADGHLHVTDGNETDFGRIEDDILDLCRRFNVVSVAYDPWAATQLAQRMTLQGVPMVEFRAHTQNFSEPTKELEAAIRAERVEHDGNPVLDWCIGNVVGHYDARSNVYPRKQKPEQKIDAAVATIMGVARASLGAGELSEQSIYETRGLLTA